MKVFISWSGERSKQIAELFKEWIQCVIQAAEPWMSAEDIDKGSIWFNEINTQLAETNIGIICLTKENIEKPWIFFESGALASGLSSNKVCTFLIDLKHTDFNNPLTNFNHTEPNKESVLALIKTINDQLGEKRLSKEILIKVFNTNWVEFESKFKKILAKTKSKKNDEFVPRNQDEINGEMLDIIRSIEKKVNKFDNEKFTTAVRKLFIRDFRDISKEEFISINKQLYSLIKEGYPDDSIKETIKRVYEITDENDLLRHYINQNRRELNIE